jgi:hypothetical protein
MMKIYKVSRTDEVGYDQFYSIIVVANSTEHARNTHPAYVPDMDDGWLSNGTFDDRWVFRSNTHTLKVDYIGFASTKFRRRQVIHASFRAG